MTRIDDIKACQRIIGISMTEDEWVESGYLEFERMYFNDLVLRGPWATFVAWLRCAP